MANFSTALEALGSGVVSLEVISFQLKKILEQTPDYSQHLLSHLLIAKDKHVIEDSEYLHLKSVIEPYLLDAQPISISNSFDNNFLDIDHPHFNQELTTGSVIKQRFKLLEILGFGGMGRVYKGIDLLKQEAKDKNPYVAIKLLNEDFKSHPKAFISLQRESSRQQKLAHPNIATVYDFDRVGDQGTPVFITMELLEGQTLSVFIKTKLRRIGGLPFSEAFKIIKQLGSALSYAHEQGIVHSDFKPGNAFICNDGTVKTLDFGIARAVKNTVEGNSERTLFDPRNLGAFTPAYASLEMLLGKEPDTRDDIYALGCVAYELLSGKHPYDKLPATKVKENKITPKPIKGLSKKQNLTLQKALATNREDRCQTVDQFLNDLEDKYVWYKDLRTVTGIILFISAISLYGPLNNYLYQKKINSISQNIESNNDKLIEKNLLLLDKLKEADQLSIISNSKEQIQLYYDKILNTLTDIESDTYDFIKAKYFLRKIEKLYPDSNFYFQEKNKIEEKEKKLLNILYKHLNISLQDIDNFETTKTILNNIHSRIDPNHAILKEEKLANSLYEIAIQSLNDNLIEKAEIVLFTAERYFPDNDNFSEIKTRIQNTKTLEDIYSKLNKLPSQNVKLETYKKYENDINKLSTLDETNVLLKKISQDVETLFNEEIEKLRDSKNRKKVDFFLTEYEILFESLHLNEQYLELQFLHLNSYDKNLALDKNIENIQNRLKKFIIEPKTDSTTWKKSIDTELSKLDFIQKKYSTKTNYDEFLEEIADIFVNSSISLMDNNQFKHAKSHIEVAKSYYHKHAKIQLIEQQIESQLAHYTEELKISELKKTFDLQINANELEQAIETYSLLNRSNNDDDYYIDTYAPKKLSELFSYKATSAAEKSNFKLALKLTNDGLDYYPLNQELSNQKQLYQIEIYDIELKSLFQNEVEFNSSEIQQKFGQIESISPDKYIKLRQRSVKTLSDRINTLKNNNTNQAITLAQNATVIFPGSALSQLLKELVPELWPDNELVNTLLQDGKLSEAQNILDSVSDNFIHHPDVIQAKQTLNSQQNLAEEEYKKFLELKLQTNNETSQLITAELQLQKARALWTDNDKYSKDYQDVMSKIRSNDTNKTTLLKSEETDFAQTQKKSTEIKEQTIANSNWQPKSSGRTCSDKLASYGRRAKAVCYDLVNATWRGPLLVVIPPGNNINNFYAISKYEISVNDFSKYCYISGKCHPETAKDKQDLPITSISYEEAQSYIQWLNKRTGKSYRLPTKAEWQHAASAAGKQPEKDVNCRLAVGDKLIKGANLISIKSGQANGWGLKNYIGNVQEWVTDDSGIILAVGGAYTDAMSKCDLSLQRNHSGKKDNITGFRVVLDDI